MRMFRSRVDLFVLFSILSVAFFMCGCLTMVDEESKALTSYYDEEADWRLSNGLEFYDRGQLSLADVEFERALNIARMRDAHGEISILAFNLAIVRTRLAIHIGSEELLKQAYELFNEALVEHKLLHSQSLHVTDSIKMITRDTILIALAKLQYLRGDLLEAKSIALDVLDRQSILAIHITPVDRNLINEANLLLTNIYLDTNTHSISYLESSLMALEDVGHSPMYDANLANLRGRLATARGEYSDAVSQHINEVEILKASEFYWLVPDAMSRVAKSYLSMNRRHDAFLWYRRAGRSAMATEQKKLARTLFHSALDLVDENSMEWNSIEILLSELSESSIKER